MSGRPTRQERATQIAAAIARFEQGAPTQDHDGRLVAEHLGTEAGFGGSPASRRQQVQQYFKEFPDLKRRWQKLRTAAAETAGPSAREQGAELAEARAEAARLRAQVDALLRVADLHRRHSERLQRQLDQQRNTTHASRRGLVLGQEGVDAQVIHLCPSPAEPDPEGTGTR